MDRDKEMYRRYIHAKGRKETSVYLADLFPNELMPAGRRSVALLDRLDWSKLIGETTIREVWGDANWNALDPELVWAIKSWQTFFGV